MDEIVITIHGAHQSLWRAVDQDGDTIDIRVQPRRNKKAVVRFSAAHREVMPSVEHINQVYANNGVEVSHQPTRQQEDHMRGFASSQQTQCFLMFHGLTQNLFCLGRHFMQAVNYRIWRAQSFQVWKALMCA